MTKANWDEAPEGATHSCDQGWYKFCGCLGDWYYWSPTEGGWLKTPYASPENFSWWGASVKRPVEWSGEGLPPVGTVCELRLKSGDWITAQIAYITETGCLWVPWGAQSETFNATYNMQFRPIRTVEQVAADTHRAKYMPELVKLWEADTAREEFLEAVYGMIAEAHKS